jgi:hypothetical protein
MEYTGKKSLKNVLEVMQSMETLTKFFLVILVSRYSKKSLEK